MKFRLLITIALMASIFCILDLTYAANGDLVVNGNLSVGSGIKFSDNTTQSSAAPGNALVWDYTVTGSPVTSANSPTLDGNAHGGYEFEFIVKNAYNGVAYPVIYFNDDKTDSNYYSSMMFTYYGALEVYRDYILSPRIVQLSSESLAVGSSYAIATGTISLTPDGVLGLAQRVWRKDGVIFSWEVNYRNTVANLTNIQIVHPNTNGIGVNSRFRLWKKK